jgi:hypothetical protein
MNRTSIEWVLQESVVVGVFAVSLRKHVDRRSLNLRTSVADAAVHHSSMQPMHDLSRKTTQNRAQLELLIG